VERHGHRDARKVLWKGTASAVPLAGKKERGFSRCGFLLALARELRRSHEEGTIPGQTHDSTAQQSAGGNMATKYRVVQVKGAKPETFIVVGIDFAANAITTTSESLQEAAMRGYLQKQGASKQEIDTWIEQARNYPG
jgi:hypothetical protein